MSHANNGQEKYTKYQPDIYVSMRDISGQKTNVTMARNSKTNVTMARNSKFFDY